jgi:putative flippase GtrA
MQWFRRPLVSLPQQLIRFAIVGTCCAALNFSIYELLVAGFDVWHVTAGACSYALSAIVNFLANKHWTFRNTATGRNAWHQVWIFAIVIGLGDVWTTLLIYAGTDALQLHYRWAWVLANAVVAGWNFFGQRLLTFRERT